MEYSLIEALAMKKKIIQTQLVNSMCTDKSKTELYEAQNKIIDWVVSLLGIRIQFYKVYDLLIEIENKSFELEKEINKNEDK